MPFIPLTPEEEQKMLKVIGVRNFEELLEPIPEKFRLKEELNLEEGKSEYEVQNYLGKLAAMNIDFDKAVNFMGAGVYDHYVPAAVNQIVMRSEFATAYTPYQPEVSQGTLQAIYEFQSYIAEITKMDVANASVYDAGTGIAEALLLALRKKKKAKNVVLYETIHPYYLEIVRTYLDSSGIEIRTVPADNYSVDVEKALEYIDNETAAVVVQTPNFFGFLEEAADLGDMLGKDDAFFISVNDPVSLAMLEAPGNYGAHIAVGEAQSFGNSVSYGGPLLGYFAAVDKLKRDMPGRIAGKTVDLDGKEGFVLTLQTREQHIRREKATSNICSNQALCALASTIYLSLTGKQGFKQAAKTSHLNALYAFNQIKELNGFETVSNKPFFREFAIKTPVSAERIIKELYNKNILAGVNLGWFRKSDDDKILLAFTEKRTKEEIDLLVSELSRF